MKFRHIRRIGVELEGGWDTQPEYSDYLKGDSSVNISGARYYVGELASPPLLPHELDQFMEKAHPQHTNRTCGLHVHMSFRSLSDYLILCQSNKFQTQLVERLLKWGSRAGIPTNHPFWDRIRNGCGHAVSRFAPWSGDRYLFLNFREAYRQHRTFEFRMLPGMPDWKLATQAVKLLMVSTESYLRNHKAENDRYGKFTFNIKELAEEGSRQGVLSNKEIDLDRGDAVDLAATPPDGAPSRHSRIIQAILSAPPAAILPPVQVAAEILPVWDDVEYDEDEY